ncbi:MAG: type II secretion system protein [Phycisphaerales bacterium]
MTPHTHFFHLCRHRAAPPSLAAAAAPPVGQRAFTIIELLVVVSIIGLLIAILLPAISNARTGAKQTMSLSNLRNLGTAHGSYAAEWRDQQFTLINANMSQYGDDAVAAFAAYAAGGSDTAGDDHPGVNLGWGYENGNGAYRLFNYQTRNNIANARLCEPIVFEGPNFNVNGFFGSFRLINCRQFNQYVSGKFYDPVFYAPTDTIVLNSVEGGDSGYNCFDDPGEYCDRPPIAGFGDAPTWSSYILSPAAMFNPTVLKMRRFGGGSNTGGYQDPYSLAGGFRSPAYGQARYPSLKTHMLEHHWLQNRRIECNPAIVGGTYGGCEPHYFNAAWESSPMTLFYDGHVGSVGVRKAMRADGRIKAQVNGFAGLWSRDTPFGADGYYSGVAYDDQALTSFHILTSDGILGRDIVSE